MGEYLYDHYCYTPNVKRLQQTKLATFKNDPNYYETGDCYTEVILGWGVPTGDKRPSGGKLFLRKRSTKLIFNSVQTKMGPMDKLFIEQWSRRTDKI